MSGGRSQTGRLTVIGVPVYNGAAHLEEALQSLLGQTAADLSVVVVDDCSSDASPEIVGRNSEAGYERNDRRLGLVPTWRRAFEAAIRASGDASYFAWGSDHDVWHPEWLQTLVGALEDRPEAVLAYPRVEAIADDGSPFKRGRREFDTAGMTDPLARLREANAGMRAGDMIYGLYRVEALRRCGPFPATLLPDRLLLARLALEGEFVQVERSLWKRRYREGVRPSRSRQRRSLLAGQHRLLLYLPWSWVHAIWFFRSLDPETSADRLRTTRLYVRSARAAVAAQRRAHNERVRRRRRKARRARLAGLRRRLPALRGSSNVRAAEAGDPDDPVHVD